MRGADYEQSSMFSYISAERRVPKDHPLRAIRTMADVALKRLNERFAGMYAAMGRPSIPPERLLRALLLQVLYTVRSERLLMEQLDYNFLFRWFVGLSIDDLVWDVTVFTKTATGCSRARWPKPSLRRCWVKHANRDCCRTSISRSTAR
jgi:transposase